MKRYLNTPITAAYKDGLISIWWYTDSGEFWDFTTTMDDAIDDHGFLQYSITQNHMTLWNQALNMFVDDEAERTEYLKSGYKSIERGKVIFNIRTQSYEIICSSALAENVDFRNKCISYFNLSGNRYDFVPLHHYGKMALTGNEAIDRMYYE